MRTKTRYLPFGTISHGTLIARDLFEALDDALRDVRLSRADRARVNALRYDMRRRDCAAMQHELFEDLEAIAECYVPPYCYLGMHEGDGSDLGVWFASDSFEEDRHNGELTHIDLARGYTGLVYDVSDHGNVTIYQCSRGRCREVLAIV